MSRDLYEGLDPRPNNAVDIAQILRNLAALAQELQSGEFDAEFCNPLYEETLRLLEGYPVIEARLPSSTGMIRVVIHREDELGDDEKVPVPVMPEEQRS